jgi:hypothetical protein
VLPRSISNDGADEVGGRAGTRFAMPHWKIVGVIAGQWAFLLIVVLRRDVQSKEQFDVGSQMWSGVSFWKERAAANQGGLAVCLLNMTTAHKVPSEDVREG